VSGREGTYETWHPGLTSAADNIGAILAVADWLSRTARSGGQKPLTMENVLLGLIKAYEIQGCLQICNTFNQIGLDHTFLVKIASTAIVSWLLGLTEIQSMDALSQAWMDNAPLRVFRHHPNTGPRKGWAAGDACMRAVHLTWLTIKGQPGAPTVLTTPSWGFYSTFLNGREFEIPGPLGTRVVESVFFRIYEVEEHATSALEAAVEVSGVVKEAGLSVIDDIAHVHVRTHQAALISSDKQGPLHNAADRYHCMPYTIAVALLKGSMTESADYQSVSPWANDPCVEALRKKIDLVEEPQFTADYHDHNKRSASSGLTVTLKDGTKIEEVVREYPLGHPRREETISSVRKKLKKNVEGWYGKGEKAQNILRLEPLKEELFRTMPVCNFVDRFAGE
jgi:2-methylcitrate dehydratase